MAKKKKDISNELYRLYRFEKNTAVVKNPVSLVVDDEGQHIIEDAEGRFHEIKPDWIHLRYELKNGKKKEVIQEEKE